MEKLLSDKTQRWITFCPFEVKTKLGLNIGYLFNEEFNQAYAQIEKAFDDGVLKVATAYVINDLWKHLLQVAFERGRPYVAFIDKINRDNPNKHDGVIFCVNLCVAPETQILTTQGYKVISELVDQEVTVWNGQEWSDVTVVKTGEKQKLLKVVTSSGQELDCTEYHKFYVQRDYKSSVEEVRTYQLKPGDKLIKFDLPVVEGHKVLSHAYTNGFFSGDGNIRDGIKRTYLYHNKRNLISHITNIKSTYEHENQNRTIVVHNHEGLQDKFFVPVGDYTIESRLQWLAGILDSDGTVARNGVNEALQLTSIHKEFLKEIQLMLQTLGVTSKVTKNRDEGDHLLPLNNGTGNSGLFTCNATYRLLISSNGLFKLSNLGLKTHRLVWSHRKPQREAEQFITVVEVLDEGRYDDTYCFTEHKRNMGMFNGLLTGQCVESFSNTKPDYYAHTCSLASLVVGRIPVDKLSDKASSLTRLLDNCIDLTDPPIFESANHMRDYRTIGIGIQGLVDLLAREWKSYEDLDFITEVAERIQFGFVRESIQIAIEKGPYPKFKGSMWDTGEIFDNYINNSVCSDLNWNELKSLCKIHGIRNSQGTSPAPNTSTSIFMMAGAGVMPSYAPYFYEDNKNGKTPVSSMYLQDNPMLYEIAAGDYNQAILTRSVGALQKFMDTGVSSEYIIDRNKDNASALWIDDLYKSAYRNGNKAVYYLRTIKKGEAIVKTEDVCLSCSG